MSGGPRKRKDDGAPSDNGDTNKVPKLENDAKDDGAIPVSEWFRQVGEGPLAKLGLLIDHLGELPESADNGFPDQTQNVTEVAAKIAQYLFARRDAPAEHRDAEEMIMLYFASRSDKKNFAESDAVFDELYKAIHNNTMERADFVKKLCKAIHGASGALRRSAHEYRSLAARLDTIRNMCREIKDNLHDLGFIQGTYSIYDLLMDLFEAMKAHKRSKNELKETLDKVYGNTCGTLVGRPYKGCYENDTEELARRQDTFYTCQANLEEKMSSLKRAVFQDARAAVENGTTTVPDLRHVLLTKYPEMGEHLMSPIYTRVINSICDALQSRADVVHQLQVNLNCDYT